VAGTGGGAGGAAFVTAGAAGGGGGVGGAVTITAGLGTAAANSGGAVTLTAGNSGGGGVGATITVGGGVGTSADGGTITLTPGAPAGAGAAGVVRVRAGTGSDYGRVGGALNSQFVDVGNVGAGEDDLQSYTLPANSLITNGQAIRYRAHFTIQTTGGATKRVRVKLGTTTIFDSAALGPIAVNEWIVEGLIVRTGATSQRASFWFTAGQGSGGSITTYTMAAETLSGALVLKATGESAGGGEANNDIVQHLSLVEFIS
jgi:hypothetical protein